MNKGNVLLSLASMLSLGLYETPNYRGRKGKTESSISKEERKKRTKRKKNAKKQRIKAKKR